MNTQFSWNSSGKALISIFISVLILISANLFAYTQAVGEANNSMILSQSEIPAGMQFGKIPRKVKKVIKANPWILDSDSIAKLSKAIYHNPQYWTIRKMVMVILAPENRPYQDDIVYYGFEFRDKNAADTEYSKLKQVQKLNSNRSILLRSDRKAILLFSDNSDMLPMMMQLSILLQQKMGQ